MDYVPIATSLGAKHAKIPFFATHRLTADVPFRDFPQKYRIETSDRSDSRIKEEEIADLVQSWLFFGLIGTLIGEELEPEAFRSVDDAGHAFVDLGRLTQIIASRQSKPIIPTHPSSLPKQTTDPLSIAKSSLGRLEQLLFKIQHPSLDLVTLSVRMLVNWWARDDTSPFYKGSEASWASARALRRLMLDNFWCEYHWGQVRHEYDIETLYYLATIPRHTGVKSRHEVCSLDVCRGWGNSADASAMHVTSMCQCSMIGISTEDLCKIIEQGDVPLILAKRHRDGHISLKLRAWDGWTPYTAVSHVWADGLGNVRGNSLPQCQLQRLHQLLGCIESRQRCGEIDFLERYLAGQSHPFWLDTLCIPVRGADVQMDDPERQDAERIVTAKRKAIDSMGFIYTSASPVMVLDAELLSLPRETEETALISMITYCGWMTRAWTLQEGSLPKKLVFACSASQIYDIEERMSEYANQPLVISFPLFGLSPRRSTGSPQIVDNAATRRKGRLQRFWKSHVSRLSDQNSVSSAVWMSEEDKRTEEVAGQVRTLLATWNSLSRRHTSQLEDVPIILANLLRLQTSDLHHRPEPIATIFGSLSALPLSIFFLTGSHFTTDTVELVAEPPENSYISNDTTTIEPVGPILNRPLKSVLDYAKNRWVPRAIDGELAPSPLYFTVQDYSLSLNSLKSPLAPSQLFFVGNRTNLPDRFFLLSSDDSCPKLLIQIHKAREEESFIREIEKIATGLYFFLDGGYPELRIGRDDVKGAVFAAISSERRNAQTIFYFPFRALVLNRSETTDGAEQLDTIRATPESISSFNVLYDKSSLGSIREERFSSRPQHDEWFLGLGSKGQVCLLPALTNLAFTAVIFVKPRHAVIPALGTVFAVYWVAIISYSMMRIFLKSWLLRFSVRVRFNIAESSSTDLRVKLAIFTIMNKVLNSGLTYVLVLNFFHWALVIAMITAGGTVGALFAFAQALVLFMILFWAYLPI